MSPVAVEQFVAHGVRWNVEPILRMQGYRDLDRIAPEILEVTREMMAEARGLARPRVWFGRHPIERITSDSLAISGGPTFRGQCFGAHLARAREVVCFVATIGSALEKRVAEMLCETNLLEAVLLDTVGWFATEETVRTFRAHIKARVAAEQLRLGARLGPGYLDWALTDQASLFSLFGGRAGPVVVSEDFLMTPAKSLSGLFGLMPIDTEA